MNGFKIGAAVCCFVYVLAFLLLPFVVFMGVSVLSLPGSELLSSSFWGWLVLLAGIAMGVCALLADGMISGIVCAVGAFVPLIAFFVTRSTLIPVDLYGAGSVIARFITQVGAGVILPVILGIAAAALCFLSGYKKQPKKITAGLGADTDDDW